MHLYLAVGTVSVIAGDYRSLYEYKLRRTESQRMKLVEKLRNMKKKEQLSRERTKAKVITPSSLLNRGVGIRGWTRLP